MSQTDQSTKDLESKPNQQTQEQQKKLQIWQIYNQGDFIDAKDSQGDWRVGYIIDKNINTKWYKIRFDGWASKYDQTYKFTSAKIQQFRSIVIGYTGQKINPGIRSGWKFTLQSHQEKFKLLQQFDNDMNEDKNMTAHRVNQFLRGHNYFYTDFLMTLSYSSQESMKQVLNYFKFNILMATNYIKNVDHRFIKYKRSLENQSQSHLVDANSAIVCAFPQVIDMLYTIFCGYPRLSFFYKENTEMLKKILGKPQDKGDGKILYLKHMVIYALKQAKIIQVLEQLLMKKLSQSYEMIPFLFLKSLANLYEALISILKFSKKDTCQNHLLHLLEITKNNLLKMTDKDIKTLHKSNVTDLLDTLVRCHQGFSNQKEVLQWSLVAELNLCLRMIKCPYFDKRLKGINGLIQIIDRKKEELSDQLLLKWAKQTKLFYTLFTDNDNPELMKKASDFARQLHLSDILPDDVLFLIWDSRAGKHQTALQQIYNFAAGVPLRAKSNEIKIQFFNKIAEVPQKQWDQDYIKLVKQYTSNALGWIGTHQKITHQFGFNILYKNLLIKKDSTSFAALIDILERFQKADNFVNMCYKNIKNDNESQIHISLLLRIANEQIFKDKTNQPEQVQILIKDLLRKNSVNSKKLSQKFDLLSSELKANEMTILFQDFIDLWNAYINSPGRKDFINWVYKKRDGFRIFLNPHISSDVKAQIFEKLWSLDNEQIFINMQEDQATILIQYFKSVNQAKGKMKKLNYNIKIESINLIGFEKIQKAFNLCKDEKLADTLADLIVKIYMSPGKSIKQTKQQIINMLLDSITNNLKIGLADKNFWFIKKQILLTSKAIARQQQILDVKNFIPKFLALRDYNVTCKARQQQKVIRFNFGGTFYEFKKLVAEKFRIPIKYCKLYHKGQIIKQQCYFKAMNQCSFTGVNFELIQSKDQPAPVKNALSQRLENFFNLLGQSEVQKQAWKIVSQLPLSKNAIQTTLKARYPWVQITNDSLYRQLYMLKAVNLMAEKWWHQFINEGGFNYLINKLNRIQSKNQIQRQYFFYLTTIINNGISFKPKQAKIPQNCFIECIKSLETMLRNIQKIEFKNQIIHKQIKIIKNVFDIGQKAFENGQQALNCIVRDLPSFEEFLRLGLIQVNQFVLRKQFQRQLQTLNEFSEETAMIMLETLLKKIFQFTIASTEQRPLVQYFEYTSHFMTKVGLQTLKSYIKNKNSTLISNMFRLIKQQSKQANIQSINYLLWGQLKLLAHLIQLSTTDQKINVSDYVISQCLFSQDQPKCQSKQSRFAALQLLRIILRDPKIQKHIIYFFSSKSKKGLWRTRKYDDWTITQTDKQKSSTGYVGLKNLGCTCYMNSFFQQIFMIPQFRNGILQCQDPFYDPKFQEQNVLFQLKQMFMALSYSSKKFYHPKSFCIAFKDYQGNPTNVNQQMDIDQFSGILFDRIENQIKGTKHESIVKDLFGGVFSNQIICKGCPHFSQTEEHFLSIPLTVKNKKDVYQSFDTMIKGDNLDGDNAYFCQRCSKKVSAVKRVCLKKLPDYLILALKRFQFDYQTMTKSKINDYYEFPNQINLKNYSQQHLRTNEKPNSFDQQQILPDQYFQYSLKGVVIHLGYADSGHYYSFIQQRKQGGKWFDFNDTTVRPFDSKRLVEEAFGGQIGHIDVKQKIKNAYLLIYDRKKKKNTYLQNIQSRSTPLDFLSSPAYVEIRKTILMENRLQKIESLFFSNEYYKFLQHVLEDMSHKQQKQVIQLLKFVILKYLTVTVREKEEASAFNLLKKIQPLLQKSSQACEWFLTVFSSSSILDQFYKDDPIRQIKKLISNWLSRVATFCSFQTVKLFINALLRYITTNNENFSDICMILFNLMNWKQDVCDYIIQKGIIGRMMENLIRRQPRKFSNIEDLQIPKQNPDQGLGKPIVIERTAYQLSRKPKAENQNGYVWAIIIHAINICKKRKVQLSTYITQTQFNYLNIPLIKIYKILEELKSKFQIKKFVQFLCYLSTNDQQFSQEMLNYVYKGIKDFESKRYRQFFILYKNLIKIDDEFKEKRLLGFRKVLLALQQNQKYTLDADIIQQWMIKTLRKSSQLRDTLKKDMEIIQYLARVATKKAPSQDLIRKHIVYTQNMVNKLHGIKILRTKRGYAQLNKQKEQFFLNLRLQGAQIQADEWDSDDDLTQTPIKQGDTIAYFNQKEALQFIQVKVEQVLLNRIWFTPKKMKTISTWNDDEKLTKMHKLFEEDLNHPGSDKTTQMDPDEQDSFGDLETRPIM